MDHEWNFLCSFQDRSSQYRTCDHPYDNSCQCTYAASYLSSAEVLQAAEQNAAGNEEDPGKVQGKER